MLNWLIEADFRQEINLSKLLNYPVYLQEDEIVEENITVM